MITTPGRFMMFSPGEKKEKMKAKSNIIPGKFLRLAGLRCAWWKEFLVEGIGGLNSL